MARRTIVGRVASNKNDKTITVVVDTRVTHPVYKKQYTKSQKFYVHDESNDALVGDIIEAEETRPFSKTKTWKMTQVLEKANVLDAKEKK